MPDCSNMPDKRKAPAGPGGRPATPFSLQVRQALSSDGRPVKPARMASADEQARVWRLARGLGELRVAPMNPYGFAWRVLSGDGSSSRGETLAYWVSREYMWTQPRRSMAGWHLSNAALTIWLTRHWAGEELATALVPVTSTWPPRAPRQDMAEGPAQP